MPTPQQPPSAPSLRGGSGSGGLDDGVLPLSYKVVAREADKPQALRLVADSIAQQRQVASAAVIFHPLCVSGFVAVCAMAYRQYQHQGCGTLMTMFSGVAIVYLAAVRFCTSRYLQLAEEFRWKAWLAAPDGGDDTVIAAVFGEETIGAVVLRLQPKAGQDGGQGFIRAWTTRLRYRGKGVGSDLLQVAVQTTKGALGPDATVEFAPDHANSVNPLPDMFNRPFKKRQSRAVRALAHALEDDVKRSNASEVSE